MARRRPKEHRRKLDAATRCSGVCPHTWPDFNEYVHNRNVDLITYSSNSYILHSQSSVAVKWYVERAGMKFGIPHRKTENSSHLSRYHVQNLRSHEMEWNFVIQASSAFSRLHSKSWSVPDVTVPDSACPQESSVIWSKMSPFFPGRQSIRWKKSVTQNNRVILIRKTKTRITVPGYSINRGRMNLKLALSIPDCEWLDYDWNDPSVSRIVKTWPCRPILSLKQPIPVWYTHVVTALKSFVIDR